MRARSLQSHWHHLLRREFTRPRLVQVDLLVPTDLPALGPPHLPGLRLQWIWDLLRRPTNRSCGFVQILFPRQTPLRAHQPECTLHCHPLQQVDLIALAPKLPNGTSAAVMLMSSKMANRGIGTYIVIHCRTHELGLRKSWDSVNTYSPVSRVITGII